LGKEQIETLILPIGFAKATLIGGLFLYPTFFKQKLNPKRKKKNHEKRKKKAESLVGLGEKQIRCAVYGAAGCEVAK